MPEVRVGPGIANPTHDLAISDAIERWGMRVEGGIKGIQELSQSPSTLIVTGAGKKYGSGDPTFSHIQQNTWEGGRGLEDFADDETRYYSGQFLWSLTPGKLFPAPLWKWAPTDHRDYNMHQQGSVTWHQLRGAKLYYGSKFTVAAQNATSYAADKLYLLIRRRGNPGTLTAELWTDSAGSPSAIIATITATATTATVPDVISKWQVFNWTSTTTLNHGTDYWVIVYGGSSDTAANHWEVGVDASGSASMISSDGSTWAAASSTMYYRVVDADVAVKCHPFFLDGTTMYMVTEPASGTSKIYVWDETNDEWDYVGTLTGDALSNIVYSVAVSKNIAHMARSTTETIFTFYNNGGTYTGQDDATAGNTADRLLAYNDPVDGPQILRAENSTQWTVSRSAVKAFNTDLVFGSDIQLPQGFNVLKMVYYNGAPYIRTTAGWWTLVNDRLEPVNVGLDAVIEQTSYDAPALVKDLFLFFGWWASVERLYAGTLDDVGPWRDAGLVDGFQGVVSAIAGGVGMDFLGVDGGSANTSSVFATTRAGALYHPIWQAWEAGQRVRNVWVQPQNGTTNPARVWISVGTDTVYIDLPDASLNPIRDANQSYCWEGVLEMATLGLETASLPKLFKELDIVSRNLGSTCSIGVDYQLDDDVGSIDPSTWVVLTDLYHSPNDIAGLNLGNAQKIRMRLRLMTSSATTPPIVDATVMKGIARTPVKRQWNLRVRIGDLQRTKRGTSDHDPRDFYRWYLKSSQSASALLLEANEELMDSIYVFVEPPSLFRRFLNTIQSWMGGTVAVTLREA